MNRGIDGRQGRILVMLPLGLGSVIMVTPALRALSREVGAARLSVLALKASTAAMARSSGLASETFLWDPDNEGLGRGLALLRELRSARFAQSLALFPSANWKAAAYQLVIGASRRLGFEYPRGHLARLVQHRSIPLTNTHDVYQNLRLVEAFLGRPIADPGEPFFPMEAKAPDGLPKGPFFACHPGSSVERGMELKRLPVPVIAELIVGLSARAQYPCVLVGGPEEAELKQEVAARSHGVVATVAARSLEETAGILSRARFFLGNDSGLMHLAAALGTRCAAFFGPTDEQRNGPFGYWENEGGAPRHLILRRPGTQPAWTLRTIGHNPPLGPQGSAAWSLDVSLTLNEMSKWIALLDAGTVDKNRRHSSH
jgi:heptosyltransferase I